MLRDPSNPRSWATAPWSWRDGVVVVLLLVVAVGLRAVLLQVVCQGQALPLGADGDNWVHMAEGILTGRPETLMGHRYPLLPWLAVVLFRGFGTPPVVALVGVSFAASVLLAPVSWWVARGWLPPGLALGVGLLVALHPALAAAALMPTAYAFFALCFVMLAGCLLASRDGLGVASLAALAACAGVACLAQGLLCVLVLIPAGLLARRWRVAAAAVAGALLGLILVYQLHPAPHTPLVWMGKDAWRYLSGNLAEEMGAMAGTTTLDAWVLWAPGGLGISWALAAPLLALGALGVLLPVPLLVRILPRRVVTWLGRHMEPEALPLGARLGLVWAAAPAAALILAVASTHHLWHLLPVLILGILVGARRLFAPLGHPVAAAVLIVLGLAAMQPELTRSTDGHMRRAEQLRSHPAESP